MPFAEEAATVGAIDRPFGLRLPWSVWRFLLARAQEESPFFNMRVLAMLPLGFASGLPLALSGGTLQAWLTVAGVDIRAIGAFSLVGLPYSTKFLWAPLLDRFSPPILGRRRGWILLFQLGLCGVIVWFSSADPVRQLPLFGAAALVLAFLSASQDVVADAYRTDLLRDRERGMGVGAFVTSYRLAMLVSGALALVLADRLGWRPTYLLMACALAAAASYTPLAPEPARAAPPPTLAAAVAGPVRDLMERPGVASMLALIVLYKLGDAFAGTLTTAFLIRGAGFTPTDVGVINKGLGLVSTIAGAVGGGALMARLGLFRSLMGFGMLQAVSNLSFALLALVGKSYPLMVAAVGFENLSGGMGTAAFVAFLMALCSRRHSATQYALLSALASVGRVVIGPPAGLLAASASWPVFFLITFLAALPGLILLHLLRHRLEGMEVPCH